MMAAECILIVDPNQSHINLEKLALAESGYDIRTAVSADEALEVLERFQPQLILMEIQLPGMDGFELTRRIKAGSKFHNVMIVAVTAYAMKGDKELSLEVGYDGYKSKPIDVVKFPQMIANYLHNKGVGMVDK